MFKLMLGVKVGIHCSADSLPLAWNFGCPISNIAESRCTQVHGGSKAVHFQGTPWPTNVGFS